MSVAEERKSTQAKQRSVHRKKLADKSTVLKAPTRPSQTSNHSVLEICRNDLAALNAFLALTIWEQTRADQSVADVESLEYEARALEALRLRITESGDSSNGTILTIAILSRFERLRGNEETARFHEAALDRLLEDRDGIEALVLDDERIVTVLQRLRQAPES